MPTKAFFLSLCLCLCLSLATQAQYDTTKRIRAIQACEVNILGGGYFQPAQYGTIDEFKILAPGSQLLKGDFTGYNQYNSYFSTYNSMFSVNLGFRFANKSKTAYLKNPLFRLGVTYLTTTDLSNGLSRDDSFRSDTLISMTSGQIYYIDSTVYRTYNMAHSSDQLRLDLSLIYRTDPQARWQFYGGFGITAGVSLKSYTNIYYTVGSTLNSTDYYFYPAYGQVYDSKSEYFKNSADFGATAYVPLGIDFRMGKKRPFWKRTHLFYELRPGAGFTSIGDLDTYGNVSIHQGLGLKVNWE